MPREILWTDAEEIGIQLTEKFPDLDPLTVRFTDLHRYVTELEGFTDDPANPTNHGLRLFRWPGTKNGRMRRVEAGVLLEHFSYCCRALNGSLNHAFASSAVSSGSN